MKTKLITFKNRRKTLLSYELSAHGRTIVKLVLKCRSILKEGRTDCGLLNCLGWAVLSLLDRPMDKYKIKSSATIMKNTNSSIIKRTIKSNLGKGLQSELRHKRDLWYFLHNCIGFKFNMTYNGEQDWETIRVSICYAFDELSKYARCNHQSEPDALAQLEELLEVVKGLRLVCFGASLPVAERVALYRLWGPLHDLALNMSLVTELQYDVNTLSDMQLISSP